MMTPRVRAAVVVVAVIVACGVVWWLSRPGAAPQPSAAVRPAEPRDVAPVKPEPAAQRDPTPAKAPSSAAGEVEEESPASRSEVVDALAQLPFFDRDSERAFRWSEVDLDAVRLAMPDNAFWTLGAPTRDEAVLEARAEREARMNDAWGQVLSGNASEADIQAYYSERHRVSSDYVEFAEHLLANYRDVLPESDVGLLEFSSQIHRSRMQQMPRRLMEALERKEQQDRLREAWLADEAAFEQALESGADPLAGSGDDSPRHGAEDVPLGN